MKSLVVVSDVDPVAGGGATSLLCKVAGESLRKD